MFDVLFPRLHSSPMSRCMCSAQNCKRPLCLVVTEALTLRSNSKTQKNPHELDANQVTKTKVLNGVILFREISVAKKRKGFWKAAARNETLKWVSTFNWHRDFRQNVYLAGQKTDVTNKRSDDLGLHRGGTENDRERAWLIGWNFKLPSSEIEANFPFRCWFQSAKTQWKRRGSGAHRTLQNGSYAFASRPSTTWAMDNVMKQ